MITMPEPPLPPAGVPELTLPPPPPPVFAVPAVPEPGQPEPGADLGEPERELTPEEQRAAVIEKVTAALVEAVGAPKENVRVWITEVPKENWGIAGVTAKDKGR